MKKLLALTVTLILVLSLLAACGGSATNPPATNSPAGDATNLPGDPTQPPVEDPTQPGEENPSEGLEGRLVSGNFSMEAPEGWETAVKEFDPEATNPDTGSYIQLTGIGLSGTVQETIDRFAQGTQEDVKIGGLDAKKTSGYGGGIVYYVPSGSSLASSIAMITVIQKSPDDAAGIEAALASFRED